MIACRLLLLLFVQVASSEWVLGVQIQHFENLCNVEIKDGKYCCCDKDELCANNIYHWSTQIMQWPRSSSCLRDIPSRTCQRQFVQQYMCYYRSLPEKRRQYFFESTCILHTYQGHEITQQCKNKNQLLTEIKIKGISFVNSTLAPGFIILMLYSKDL